MKKLSFILSVFFFILSLFITGCSVDSSGLLNGSTESVTKNQKAQNLLVDKGEYYLLGDDIILVKDEPNHQDLINFLTGKSSDSRSIKTHNTNTWPNGKIPYYFNTTFTAAEKTTILSAMESLEDVCNVDFYESTAGDYKYKISKINDPNIGGRSTLGYIKTPYVDLVSTSWGTCVHEFMHGLGIKHEHQRPDRDSFVTINFNNIIEDYKYAFDKIASADCDTYGPYDYDSIMHYSSMAFNSNGKVTIEAKGNSIGQRNHLSGGDITGLEILYPIAIKSTDAVSRDSQKIDIVKADKDGLIKTAASNEANQDGTWRGWWGIANGVTADNGYVSIVSRDSKKLDVFTVGLNNKVYSAAWDSDIDGGNGWRGWWAIGTLTCPKNQTVAAVSRASNKLDIFAIGTDGGIYTAAWDSTVSNGDWRGWWRINNGSALSGSELSAVSRTSGSLDLFTVGTNGNVYQAAWDQNISSGNWRGWWSLGSCGMGVSTVKAVNSSSNRLHVFAVRLDGQVFSNEVDYSISGNWTGWKRVGTIVATPFSKVAPVSRKAGFVDIFVLGNDQHVYTAAWENGRDTRNTYRGWWDIGSGFTARTSVSAVAKDATTLDVFGIKAGGEDVYCKTWTSTASWSAWVRLP